MSTLTDNDKRCIENILDMGGGYVLDYTNATFDEFFRRYHVDIHSQKYRTYGDSKAKKLRSFWEQESDVLVGRVLSEMLDSYEITCDLKGTKINGPILERTRGIVARLLGTTRKTKPAKSDENFLQQEFATPDLKNFPVEHAVVSVIESRLHEVRISLEVGAHLSVVVLCGSILEGILLGCAQKHPALFNRSSASPRKTDGKVKQFHDWTLSQFIDVASDVRILKPDVQKFSHGLRHFRNYIHPYEQMASGFTPDEHTAKLCFQVLKAALASVAGERR